MRHLGLLVLSSLIFAAPVSSLRQTVFAAPVPKTRQIPDVELKLSAENQLVLDIIIRNNGLEPLEIPYRFTPFEHFSVELQGENGMQYVIQFRDQERSDDKAEPGTLRIPAGKSESLSLHTCHSLPELGDKRQKVTFTAWLKHDGKTIVSQPLTVDP